MPKPPKPRRRLTGAQKRQLNVDATTQHAGFLTLIVGRGKVYKVGTITHTK